MASPQGPMLGLRRWLSRPEDIASMALFRFAFGLLLAGDALRYLSLGRVPRYFSQPPFLFKFYGFAWVEPLPTWAMQGVFGLIVGAGVAAALGLHYRLAMTILWLTHCYTFLCAAERYLNHEYLICLLTFLMIWLPVDRGFSIDRYPGNPTGRGSLGQPHHDTLPRWPRLLLLLQLGIVYVFGGIAKINHDWLTGTPIRQWLGHSAESLPHLADILRDERTITMVCWGGMFFDLLIAPILWWRRTRPIGVLLSVGFHLTNATIFNIGVFPYLMLAATTLFFEPDWPRRLARLLRLDKLLALLVPLLRRLKLLAPAPKTDTEAEEPSVETAAPSSTRLLLSVGATYALAGWLLLQIAMPLRHHLYPGDVAWTEDGHYFSWRMKLRSKRGRLVYRVVDPTTSKTTEVRPEKELRDWQLQPLAGRPQLILQYAHHLADRHEREHGVRPQVFVKTYVSLNYRKDTDLIDPEVDLAREAWTLGPAPWVIRDPQF